jgi:hypothetical protein
VLQVIVALTRSGSLFGPNSQPGTQGVNEVVTGLVGQGLSILETLRTAAVNGDGAAGAVPSKPVLLADL